MCGIAGIWMASQSDTPDENLLWSIILSMRHRGPDAQDIWTAPGVGLAHARLSILDLNPRSNQPMEGTDTGNMIVFNGEIYNYIELRQELIQAGYSFHTESDTEVILKAYQHWGPDCLTRFNGMWSLALWDKAAQRLFCARDRFGIKPFVYGQTQQGHWVFASEHKALWTHFLEFKQPNIPLLTTFIQDGTPFSCFKESFYRGLYHLLPGHYMMLDTQSHQQEPKQVAYYHVNQKPATPLPTLEAAQERYNQLLNESIQLRFRSDVPVGCCMSGGLDSPTLVGLATQLFKTQLKTFSSVYPEHPSADESEYIQANVEHFKTDAYTTTPTFTNFVDTLYQCVWEQDGPTGGPSVLSQRAVMALAKPHVTVLIDGQGADETLGGYHGYFPISIHAYAQDVVKKPSISSFKLLHRARQFLSERYGKHWGNPRPWKKMRQTLKGKKAQLSQWPYHSPLVQQQSYPWDDLNTLMLTQTRTSMVDLLHYEDRNSMAYSLESRLPYLDYHLVDFAFSLDHRYKMSPTTTKLLLRKAAAILPNIVLNRKDKMGFESPGQSWYRLPEMIDWLDALFSNTTHTIRSNVTPKHIEQLLHTWNTCKQGTTISGSQEMALWRFFTSAIWLEQLQHGGFKTAQQADPTVVTAVR